MQLYNPFLVWLFVEKQRSTYVCVWMCVTVLVWSSEDNFIKLLVLSFYLHAGWGINESACTYQLTAPSLSALLVFILGDTQKLSKVGHINDIVHDI